MSPFECRLKACIHSLLVASHCLIDLFPKTQSLLPVFIALIQSIKLSFRNELKLCLLPAQHTGAVSPGSYLFDYKLIETYGIQHLPWFNLQIWCKLELVQEKFWTGQNMYPNMHPKMYPMDALNEFCV